MGIPVQLITVERRSPLSDPSTYWLTFTNIALGVVTLLCCGALAIGILQELAARRKRRATMAALDTEMSGLVENYGGHAFHIPSLGVTMADGGEDLRKKDER